MGRQRVPSFFDGTDCDRSSGCRCEGAERRVDGKCRPQGSGEVGVKKAQGSGSTTNMNKGWGGRWGGRGGEEFQLRVRLVVDGAQCLPGAIAEVLACQENGAVGPAPGLNVSRKGVSSR